MAQLPAYDFSPAEVARAVAKAHLLAEVKKIAATHDRGLITDDEAVSDIALEFLKLEA